MKTKKWAIILMLACTLFTSAAQIFLKTGANQLSPNLTSILTNWSLIIGIFLYGMSAILVIIALRGGQVSTLYPIITTSFIWVTLLSTYFFQETITTAKIAGILTLIAGILLVATGEKNGTKQNMQALQN